MAATMATDAAFWDKVAEKYAKDPIADMSSYEETLRDVRKHLKPNDFVVELGCGTGTTALRLHDAVDRYLGTDISPEMIKIAAGKSDEGPEFAVGEVERGQLSPSGSVDAVLSFNHLHLVENPTKTISAAVELLRPGGLLMSKTICLSESWKFRMMRPAISLMRVFGKAPRMVQFFDIATLEAMHRDAGLEIIETADQAYPRRFIVARKPGVS